MASTERLKLLMKNTELEGTDTFNIKTMLNDNWQKIDEKVAMVDGNGKVINKDGTPAGGVTEAEFATHMADNVRHMTSAEKTLLTSRNYLNAPDTRNVNSPPTFYLDKSYYTEFKSSAILGISGGSIYCTLSSIHAYTDLTGGQVTQIAYDDTRILTRKSINATSWHPWKRILSQDDYDTLFQYANSGKTAVANAVTAKGVVASPADTFATLATKIGQISTGARKVTGSVTVVQNQQNLRLSNLPFVPGYLIVYLADTSVIPINTRFTSVSFKRESFSKGASNEASFPKSLQGYSSGANAYFERYTTTYQPNFGQDFVEVSLSRINATIEGADLRYIIFEDRGV